MKYDIKNDKMNMYWKHSDTISVLCGSEEFQVIISGSMNGEIVVWEFEDKKYSFVLGNNNESNQNRNISSFMSQYTSSQPQSTYS